MQSLVYTEIRTGEITQPWGAPLFVVMLVENTRDGVVDLNPVFCLLESPKSTCAKMDSQAWLSVSVSLIHI